MRVIADFRRNRKMGYGRTHTLRNKALVSSLGISEGKLSWLVLGFLRGRCVLGKKCVFGRK